MFCISFVLAPFPAFAEWRHDSGPLPAGRALGPGEEGIAVAVSCSNGGLPVVEVLGFTPPAGMEPMFVVSVDEGAEQLILGDCGAEGTCMLAFETTAQALGLIRALRSGSRIDVGLYRGGMLGSVGLAGSNAAIAQLAESGCDLG
jgi:hypothetical protein